MKKVLLVDDELFVRKGLKSLIDWEKSGFEVVGDTDNGEDALSLIKTLNPDLVVTDIRMPVLDGLELIKYVLEEKEYKPKFIIISGYNDFKYAQHAIRYGVQDFILKPIDKAEMEEALIKLSQTLGEEEVHSRKQEELFTHTMFEDLLSGNVNTSMLKTYIKLLGAKDDSYYYYITIEINGVVNHEVLSEEGVARNQIQAVLQKVLQTRSTVPIDEQQRGMFGFILNSNSMSVDQHNIEIFVKRLEKELLKSLHFDFTIFIGKPTKQLRLLKESYQTARQASNYKYAKKEGYFIIYEHVESIPLKNTDLDHQIYAKLFEKIEESNTESISKMIDIMFTEFDMKIFTPKAVKTSINYCVNRVTLIIEEMEGDISKIPSYGLMHEYEQYHLTLLNLKQLFEEFIFECSKTISNLRKEHAKGDIHKVKSYIENHYHENISLKSIANTFYMNPVYMGQLFKKTYGLYFKDFLLDLRIKEARKLLRQTNMRVYEIAANVGFGSTDYFVTQFEKMEGLTPTEYRNQILN
jgi:two-component system, response regulator YesN